MATEPASPGGGIAPGTAEPGERGFGGPPGAHARPEPYERPGGRYDPTSIPEPATHPVPDLRADTAMQKVVLPGLVDLLLGNVVVPGRFEPHRVAGFVTRLQDVPGGSSSDLSRRYGLDQVPGWPVTPELHVLRFYAHNPVPFVAPFERNVYRMDLLELPAGAELWRIDASGSEQRIAAYLHRQIGWVGTSPVLLGPGRWGRPPVPLRPTVRRGLVARYRGADFDADFGPKPGFVTLHPLPGRRPPDDFVEQAGTYTLSVQISELDSIALVRWRGQWRGLDVELVESSQDEAVVHYNGDDGQRAVDEGLAEVDYRVWRGPVPKSELGEVRRDTTPIR